MGVQLTDCTVRIVCCIGVMLCVRYDGCESGITSTEYGLLLAGMIIAIVVSLVLAGWCCILRRRTERYADHGHNGGYQLKT